MARPGSSGDVSYQLARMLLDEPSVRQGIRVLQAHCLCGGLMLHFGAERIPATPSFMQHIEHYYMEFCRCAIESFMTVGFAPYRIRRMRGGVRVPEILPLGAFSWTSLLVVGTRLHEVPRHQTILPRPSLRYAS